MSESSERYFALFDKVYALLSDTTPRRYDCGALCGARCCRNLACPDAVYQSGMALLPYEKEYLQSIGASDFLFRSGEDGDILICRGRCRRAFRPFACRVFPYYARLSDEKTQIRPDIRAFQVCPLLKGEKTGRMTPRFIRNYKKAVKLLSTEPVIRTDLQKTSDFIGSVYELYSMFAE